MKLISEYVAPWALPKEDVPIHLVWEKEFSYDVIRVKLPTDLIVREFFNVEHYSETSNQNGSVYLITKLRTINFFGLTVATRDNFEEPQIKRIINVTFVKDEKEIFSRSYEVNVFRPYVSIIENPQIITITDDYVQKREPFWITMKLFGFGNVQIRNEISSGGEFIESAEPLYSAIIRKVVSSLNLDTPGKARKGIEIDPLYLQRKVKEYVQRIEQNEFPLDVDKKDIESLQNWIRDSSNKEKIIELISKHVETLIVDSLLFYFERYPSDSIQMPQGKPVMFIEKATQKIAIRFLYRDAMLNEYKPIEIRIDVNDRRTNKNIPLKIPINIRWIIEKINPLGACCK